MRSSQEKARFVPKHDVQLGLAPASSVGDLCNQRIGIASLTLLAVSIYGTAMSTLFLVTAIIEPRYGHGISDHGTFSPAAAALLTAFIAKTIEISFVTSFLAFLGQFLSRKAARRDGITLANMSMRTWILQPGALFTDWKTVRFASLSFLGISTIYATALTLLYTTAANTLVQPQLRLPPWTQMTLGGDVRTQFANIHQSFSTCMDDWPDLGDVASGRSTCTHIRYTSVCYHNFAQYMAKWKLLAASNRSEPMFSDRMPVTARLEDNITVTTAWLDSQDLYTQSQKAGRTVNNITIAVPHRGVPMVARDPRNRLLQPQDLQNAGSYTIVAAVPSMTINSVCVNANRDELSPLVYETWPNAILHTDSATSLANSVEDMSKDNTYSNNTVFDDLFKWKNCSLDRNIECQIHGRPNFVKFPRRGNTVNTQSYLSILGSVRVLRSRPLTDEDTENYFLCALKAGLTGRCSTRYRASSSGMDLGVLCDDDAKNMAYNNFQAGAVETLSLPNWRDIAFDTLTSLSLNTGVVDGNASIPRVLTQLYLKNTSLNPNLPSPAEALLSMTVCSTLDLVREIPFQTDWNYTRPMLDEPQMQYLNASVQVAQYMSGGIYPYQKGFIVVLASVFIINSAILVYLAFIKIHLITDLCEPLVLFLLGYQTTAGDLFHGISRDGVQAGDLTKEWILTASDGRLVVTEKDQDDNVQGSQ